MVLRLRAAATLTTDAPWATRAFNRSSSASVHTQGLVCPVISSSLSALPDVAGLGLAIADAFEVKGQPVTFPNVVRIDAG
jgi:hypothetical protein